MTNARDMWSFLLLCLIWGSTWIGIKAGLETVPPLFLAGSRFAVAGLVLIAIERSRTKRGIDRADWLRIVSVSVALIGLCYGLLFWGMLYIDSGTAAVLEMGLVPIALLGFAVLSGDEHASARKLLALAIGLGGLTFLFGPDAMTAWRSTDGAAAERVVGALAVASAALVYGWGSVLSRPLLNKYPTMLISGVTTLIGGILLLATSFAIEPGAGRALKGDWGLEAWTGWLFLVIGGSLIGYSVYMRLLRDIGASRAGMYAFVSPVIAVALGAFIRSEALTWSKSIGMIVLLSAAWLAMKPLEAVGRQKS
ncbi:DMT family transporter [Novosphingopyxis sp.]|uniref:DMT family transporter n=1 Tax=Novosphingopyxis sp. TaxID=2709690 RepID=UPI003B5A116C